MFDPLTAEVDHLVHGLNLQVKLMWIKQMVCAGAERTETNVGTGILNGACICISSSRLVHRHHSYIQMNIDTSNLHPACHFKYISAFLIIGTRIKAEVRTPPRFFPRTVRALEYIFPRRDQFARRRVHPLPPQHARNRYHLNSDGWVILDSSTTLAAYCVPDITTAGYT